MSSGRVTRARVFDECLAVKKLASLGYKLEQGTESDDWSHVDIWMTTPSGMVGIDVKRPGPSHAKTGNFAFEYVDRYGVEYPFSSDPNRYFFFIDESQYVCYLISRKSFGDLLPTCGYDMADPSSPLQKVRIVPGSVIAAHAKYSFILSSDERLFLDWTRNVGFGGLV